MRWPIAVTKARESRNLSQNEVGHAMGISGVAYGNRERGVTQIGEDWLGRFLHTIRMDRAEFDNLVRRIPVQSVTPSADIPLYPNLASAGKRAFMPDETDEAWMETVVRGTSSRHPGAFAAKIHGDSMAPLIVHGDVVICEPLDDEDDSELYDGRVVVAFGTNVSSTGDYTRVDGEVKPKARAVIVPDGGMIGQWAWLEGRSGELRKVNAKYQPVLIPARHDGTIRLAVVVEVRRKM
jgi:hypothetical protein